VAKLGLHSYLYFLEIMVGSKTVSHPTYTILKIMI